MQNRDTQLSLMQKQNQKLQKLNNELSELLNILPNTEELLSKMEEQKTKIELLENENQQWQKLAQKLNSENSLLLKQNTELLNSTFRIHCYNLCVIGLVSNFLYAGQRCNHRMQCSFLLSFQLQIL